MNQAYLVRPFRLLTPHSSSLLETHNLALNFHKICSVNAAFTSAYAVLLFLSTEEQSSREER
jgi:hypothetical protein